MIHKVTKTYYSLSCDRCGCTLENDEADDGLFADYADMEDKALNEGWQEVDGHYLCGECVNYKNKPYFEED